MSEEEAKSAGAAAASSSSAGDQAPAAADSGAAASAAPTDTAAAPAVAQQKVKTAGSSRGIDLITGPEGDIMGFAISPAAQLYTMVDQLLATPRIIALPVAERYALAGKVAAVPSEFPRLIERLASALATCQSEAGALNALYLLETCKELVPGFKEAIPPERLSTAAELSAHQRVQSAVLHDQKPPEWEAAAKRGPQASVVLLPQEEESDGLVYEAGRAVGDATKMVGGAALGGVGLVTDTLGLTKDAEGALADTAEDAVDLLGDGVGAVVGTIDEGIGGTADDLAEKGVVGTLGDGVADAHDLLSDFVGDAVHGIAGSVRGMLDWATGDQSDNAQQHQTHRVAIVVAELFGEEKSLGLRLENRVLTGFTKPEAEKLGWKLGDCVVGVGNGLVHSQDEMLAAISASKGALRETGVAIRFLVERLGPRPEGPKKGALIFVSGRAARVEAVDPQSGTMTVQFQDDGTRAQVAAR
mmetsp:Transcript_118031/g.252109  ORF Transcript_118031/g.252109 Transcript_118031/m.252109 type:complete len:472 (+) Transcript_118031:51-1466(+)